jgi:hypothetical protein
MSEMNAKAEAALKVLQAVWKDVAKDFRINWVGPVELVLENYPQVKEGVTDVVDKILEGYSIVLFESRVEDSDAYVMAIPYRSSEEEYGCRLVASVEISEKQAGAYAAFAQAFWILIDNDVLPQPDDSMDLVQKLTDLTGPELCLK